MPIHSTIDDWRKAKVQAKKVGLDISVFKDDMASAYDKIKKAEDQMVEARKDCLKEIESFLKIAGKYKDTAEKYVDKYHKNFDEKSDASRDLAGTLSSLESWAQQLRKSLR